MRIDHIGYAVKRMDRARDSFEKLGYTFGTEVEDTDRNIRIIFGEKDGYRVELVSPLDRGQKSPVDGILSGAGPAPYHICYRSDDLDADVEALESRGFKVIIEPKPAVAFGGKRVVFMMELGIGLLEIVE